MEIRVKLDDLLYARRMTLTDLADKVGITLANLSILKTGKARAIRFSTLASICAALDCQPGDILVFENGDRPARLREGHSTRAPDNYGKDRASKPGVKG
ncbi:MAG TPA: helix-turn-helix transcriptional regulator [Rhizomicrobium sp.]|jgi:putative transcriptional regulator|nr:helix-turn-helix transcriptional regulator [Rhizomicrobium sp.]